MKKMRLIVALLSFFCLFGMVTYAVAAEIGNTIWNDYNANGKQDPGEEGISDVRVKLYNGNDVKYDTTNSQGRYKFKDLDAGHYTVVVAQETLPNGCYATYDRDGNKNGIYSDKYLHEDDYFTHADFGYKCPDHTVVTSTQKSPVTGPGAISVILATAVAAGSALFVYKRQK